jgi:hypothetical protein
LALEIIDDAPVRPKPDPVPRKKRARPRRKPVRRSVKASSRDAGRRGLVPKVPLKIE